MQGRSDYFELAKSISILHASQASVPGAHRGNTIDNLISLVTEQQRESSLKQELAGDEQIKDAHNAHLEFLADTDGSYDGGDEDGDEDEEE